MAGLSITTRLARRRPSGRRAVIKHSVGCFTHGRLASGFRAAGFAAPLSKGIAVCAKSVALSCRLVIGPCNVLLGTVVMPKGADSALKRLNLVLVAAVAAALKRICTLLKILNAELFSRLASLLRDTCRGGTSRLVGALTKVGRTTRIHLTMAKLR